MINSFTSYYFNYKLLIFLITKLFFWCKNMSVIFIEEKNVSVCWVEAVKRVLNEGDEIPTAYDKENDIPSRDATVMISIKKPMSNPMINERSKKKKIIKVKTKFENSYEVYGHKGDYCLINSIRGGYIEECLEGVFDERIETSKNSYPYSYHNRLFKYTPYSLEDMPFKAHDLQKRDLYEFGQHSKIRSLQDPDYDVCAYRRANGETLNLPFLYDNKEIMPIESIKFPEVNQIHLVIEALKKSPSSRREQAITWRPLSDPYRDDPPCLQRLHFRIKNNKLILNSHWRSRDLFKAWQSNVNAMLHIQRFVATKVGVGMGSYVDISNSLHIYGRDIFDAKQVIEHIDRN